MTYLLVCAGFILLIAGGELLVRGAAGMAVRLGMSPLLIGLTLVGFGTSTPELVTSLQAALAGSAGIAVGNVVGSNIANILLILGVTACIAPLAIDAGAFRRDGTVLAIATLAVAALALTGEIGRLAGLLLIVGLLGYIILAWQTERGVAGEDPPTETMPAYAAIGLFALGLTLTVLGARWLVCGAIDLARDWGVSETVIGLTIVAVGTSLPELVTSMVAAFRSQAQIAFGNIVGSNLYNILGILGVVGIVLPVEIPPQILRLDIWIMVAATAALFIISVTGWRITRGEGLALLAAYAAYVAWLALSA